MGSAFQTWINSITGSFGPLDQLGIPNLLAVVAGILLIWLAVSGVYDTLLGLSHGGASGEDAGNKAAKGREQMKKGLWKLAGAFLFIPAMGVLITAFNNL